MTTEPCPDIGTLLIVQRVEEGGPVARRAAVSLPACVHHWLRESGAPPLRVCDILSATKVGADGVLVHPSRGGAEPEAPMYVLGGQATLEVACDAHGTPAA